MCCRRRHNVPGMYVYYRRGPGKKLCVCVGGGLRGCAAKREMLTSVGAATAVSGAMGHARAAKIAMLHANNISAQIVGGEPQDAQAQRETGDLATACPARFTSGTMQDPLLDDICSAFRDCRRAPLPPDSLQVPSVTRPGIPRNARASSIARRHFGPTHACNAHQRGACAARQLRGWL